MIWYGKGIYSSCSNSNTAMHCMASLFLVSGVCWVGSLSTFSIILKENWALHCQLHCTALFLRISYWAKNPREEPNKKLVPGTHYIMVVPYQLSGIIIRNGKLINWVCQVGHFNNFNSVLGLLEKAQKPNWSPHPQVHVDAQVF